MDKFLSICITNKNDGETILRQLNSIVNQVHLPDELVIIDDGSTDDSIEKINYFLQKNSDKLDIKTVFYDHSLGCVSRINEAVNLSTSKYVYMGSANDYLLPEFVENLYKGMKKDHALVSCYSGFPSEKFYEGYMILKPYNCSYYIPGHCSCVKREYLLQFGNHLESLKWHSDWFFLHGISLKYGWYGIPYEFSVKTTNDNGYANAGVQSDDQIQVLQRMISMVNNEEHFSAIKDDMLTLIKNLPRSEEVL